MKEDRLIYRRGSAAHWTIRVVTVIFCLGLIVTIWVVVKTWETDNVGLLYITIGCWAILPPTWFSLEYFYIYLRWGKEERFENFKYGQQVSAAAWAGVLAGLIAFAATLP